MLHTVSRNSGTRLRRTPLTAHVRPAGQRWWARLLDTLTALYSGGPWQAWRGSHACPVPAVVRVSQPRQERNHVW